MWGACNYVSWLFLAPFQADEPAVAARYGEETPGLSRPANGAAGGAPFGFNDDFDPEQLFNMFFNGGFPGGAGGFGGARRVSPHAGTSDPAD